MNAQKKQHIIEIEGRFFVATPTIERVIELITNGATLSQCLDPIRDRSDTNCPDDKLLEMLRLALTKHGISLNVISRTDGRYLKLEPSQQSFNGSRKRSKYFLVSHILVSQSVARKLASVFTGMFTLPMFFGCVTAMILLLAVGLLHGGLTNPMDLGLVTSLSANGSVSVAYSVPAIVVIVLLCFLFHEVGHASAALKFGADVRGIGIGVYWIFPALYSDVTTVWRLDPYKRVVVDAAGIYFQCIAITIMEVIQLAPISTGVHEILAICIVYNSLVVATNLNPILRYDGYWMFSDFFDIPNLRKQANNYAYHLIERLIKKKNAPAKLSSRTGVLAVYSAISLIVSALFVAYLAMAVWSGYSHWPDFVNQASVAYHEIVQRDFGAATHAILMSIKLIIPIVLFPILIVSSVWATFKTFLLSGKKDGFDFVGV